MLARDFGYLMKTRGWAAIDRGVAPAECDALATELREAEGRCRILRIERGLDDEASGTAHHLVGEGEHLDALLDDLPLADLVAERLGSGFVLNSYGGVVNCAGKRAYLHTPHRDVRVFTQDLPLMLNMIVMLSDFTRENGATFALPGSHHVDEAPGAAFFARYAERIVGTRGTVVLFDSRLWHAAGTNTTREPRLALTLTFSRPFVKPQLDYLRKLGDDRVRALPAPTQRLLGGLARTPVTLDDWYRPSQQRFYRPGQE